MAKHKMTKVYADCSSNFDRINDVLTSLAASKKSSNMTQRMSLGPSKKIQLDTVPAELQDINNFLLLKNILKQAYTKSRDFKLNIQAASFRTLVASFLYLFEKMDVDDLVMPSNNASRLTPY